MDDIEPLIYNIIHNPENTITNKHRDIIIHLYNHFQPQIVNKKIVSTKNEFTSIGWFNIIIHMMIFIEKHIDIPGVTRKEIIIETILLIIQHDFSMHIQDKVRVQCECRDTANRIIDLIIFSSHNLNTKNKKKKKKWFNFLGGS